jgi:hypothetical protein
MQFLPNVYESRVGVFTDFLTYDQIDKTSTGGRR